MSDHDPELLDELERRGDSLLDEERYRAEQRRKNMTLWDFDGWDDQGRLRVRIAGVGDLLLSVDDASYLAADLAAEVEIWYRTEAGEI